MIAATEPIRRSANAKLLFVRRNGGVEHCRRADFVRLLQPGDLLVANDAATLPASLSGIHVPSRRAIEVRLAGRRSLDPTEVEHFMAVVFGAGDFRTRTEDRPPPPALGPGDALELGELRATIERLLDHPRLAMLRFRGRLARGARRRIYNTDSRSRTVIHWGCKARRPAALRRAVPHSRSYRRINPANPGTQRSHRCGRHDGGKSTRRRCVGQRRRCLRARPRQIENRSRDDAAHR